MMKQKGEITVFLSLVLTILISMLFTVIEAARTNAVQFQTECVADTAMQSVLAEYNRELLEQYDLFFSDIGYGTQESGYILLEQHIAEYMKDNFKIQESIYLPEIKDLLQISVESVAILEAEGMTDENGAVLERKAVDYMLDRYGLLDISKIVLHSDAAVQKRLLTNDMEEKRRKNEKAIDDVDTTIENEDGSKKKIPVNNPADQVNSRRGSSGILKLVAEGDRISEKEIRLEEYISHRNYEEKDSFLLDESPLTMAEDLVFQKYIMEKCGKYTMPKDNCCLDYEMEYVLTGKNSDYENLRCVVNKLLMIREAANFMYLMTDSAKQEEAEVMAMTLAAVILFPELKDLIKLSILIAWAYAESVNDVKVLLGGGKIPLWKDAMSWRLGLKNAMNFQIESTKNQSEQGLSYEEYLHILLAVLNKKDRNIRFMDVVEMNIRKTPGNEKFCIDHCVSAFTAEINTSSGKGHDCQITRTTGYAK